ncbi:MAG: hypothetical protein FWD27_08845 [Coriobacteriia bacterium]|nr:hypothetical protein [Coriobacteriia bacterium]
MKKVWYKLLLAAVILAVAVALTACGNNGSDTSNGADITDADAGESSLEGSTDAAETAGEDFVWFSSVVPDGFDVRGPNGNYTEIEFYQDIGGGHQAVITVSFAYGAVEEKIDDRLSSDRNTPGPDVSAGLYKWSTLDFDWNGLPSRQFFAQMSEKYVVHITGWCIAPGDSSIQTVLDSFTPSADVEDKFSEALDTSFPK